jgi:hypothetical protein
VNLCGTTRLLVIGFLIGIAVAGLTGSDALGWLAGLAGGGALWLVQRRLGITTACATDPRARFDEAELADLDRFPRADVDLLDR